MDLFDLLLYKAVVGDTGEGGGGEISTQSLRVTENGTYRAPTGKAYTPVTVAVENSYAAADEGKVVEDGALVSQTDETISQNGTVDTTTVKQVTVNVANSYAASDEGKVVSSGALVSQTDETVVENGVVDTTTIKQVTVNVPTGSEPTGTKNISISQNGTTTENVAGYASAAITVAVPIPSYQAWQGGSY